LSYSQLAQLAGYPAAVRAVATVVASNPVSLIIPCHRIVRKEAIAPDQGLKKSAGVFAGDGAVGGGELLHHYGNYRWGWQTKSRLIEWERYWNS
ncbi:MAG: methylated-DNA--[protein]-cysteine S-methyltransferase, partial [Eubacterium sp.]